MYVSFNFSEYSVFKTNNMDNFTLTTQKYYEEDLPLKDKFLQKFFDYREKAEVDPSLRVSKKKDGCVSLPFKIIPYRKIINPHYDPKANVVYYHESPERFEKGIWTSSKPGKFMKKVNPFLTDVQIEQIVGVLKVLYTEKEYTLHKTQDAKTIAEVYSEVETESYVDCFSYACINGSCMGKEFNTPCHPCEVYASGDFELWYTLDQYSKVCARTLTVPEQKSYIRIYSGTQKSGDHLSKILEEEGYSEDNFDPVGLKVLKLQGSYGLIGPYFDFYAGLEDCGDHLKIVEKGEGEYIADDTGGWLSQINPCCADCGCEYSKDDLHEIDGNLYCNNCTYYCDYYEEMVLGGVSEVLVWDSYRKTFRFESWCDSAVADHATWVESTESYWRSSDLLKDVNGDLITPEQVEDGDYVLHEGEYYSEEEYEQLVSEEAKVAVGE
jgi:hypothetical protein